jgi:hypothetical protein
VGWVWLPEGLVFELVDIKTGHVDVVYETWPEEGCMDHSADLNVNVSSNGVLAGLTYVSTLNRPQAVRLHEISMSWDNSPDAILGPVLPTKPNASPIRMAWCSMIYPRSFSRDIAYLSMSEKPLSPGHRTKMSIQTSHTSTTSPANPPN